MKPRNIILLFALLIIIGLALWGWMLSLTWGQSNPNELLVDMGKTGASLSLITVIGGLVQFLLKNRELRNQKKVEKITFYRNVLNDLKEVYDKVERARLLIEAHRTAKTYGEQMRELIGGVVNLHNIKRALNPEFPQLDEELRPSINAMNNFIKNLLNEYRDNYKHIAVLQQIDEEKKKNLIETEGAEEKPDISESDIPSYAWERIKDLEALKVLRDDLEYDEYKNLFLSHLDSASAVLRSRIPVEEE
ncbi:MAG: hypothetical protein AAFY45_12165 [Bacteroidota bacterium]